MFRDHGRLSAVTMTFAIAFFSCHCTRLRERGVEYISTVGISADRVRYICQKSLLPYKIFAPFISF